MELKFSINKQVIKRTDNETLVQGSQNYVTCSFTFDSTWASLNKKAIFGTVNENNEYVAYCEELDENDKCTVPWESLQNNELFVSVYGADDEEQLVTVNQGIVYLLESGYTTELTPTVDPSPDVFSRIFGLLDLKFDMVELVEGSLNFYANDVLITSISMGAITSVSWENVTNKPSTYPPANHVHRLRDMTEDSEHRTVSDDDVDYWNDKPVKTSDLVNDSNFVSDSNYHHTDNNFSDSEKNKLEDLENYDDSEVRELIDDLDENKADNVHQHTINDVTNLQTSLNAKVDKVTGKGLSENDFTDELLDKLEDLENYDDTNITNRISTVEGKIPSEATSSNKLADKSFVNSSIATATATFRGTYDSVAELDNITIKDLNDYAFVKVIDQVTSLVKQYDKYKYTGSAWVFEYTLNNSSFTASQWATINSGLTEDSLDDYTRTAEMKALTDSFGYLTQHQSLVNYPTFSDMNSAISSATSGMATQSWVNGRGFLTEHQSLTNYSTTAQMNTAINNAVSGKESSSNKVTSISSSSTDNQYPSAKAVYDYIQSLDASDVQYPL